MIRLLAVDIDGTLLDSRGRVPPAHRRALVDAAARGVRVALVTGRSHHFTDAVTAALPLPLTLIVNNGAVVKHADGTTLMRQALAREAAREVLAHTADWDDSVALVFDRRSDGDEGTPIVCDRMDWGHPNRARYYERNRAFISIASPLDQALTEDPIQVMFNGPVAPMRTLVGRLRTLSGGDRFSVAVTEYEHRNFSLVDVNAAGCSKGATLGRWAASLGIDAAEVMAIGDNLNDLDMLEFAGTAVVMGNAVGALRGRGFHQTGSHDDDGLAMAVHRFILDGTA